ncbi:hypothetical protein O9993_09045 [Vibrio lentus]|nr:hypothetical protein [Vibrio lentus]
MRVGIKFESWLSEHRPDGRAISLSKLLE